MSAGAVTDSSATTSQLTTSTQGALTSEPGKSVYLDKANCQHCRESTKLTFFTPSTHCDSKRCATTSFCHVWVLKSSLREKKRLVKATNRSD